MTSSRLPRIGITTYREPAAWGSWKQPADLLSVEYANAVTVAGGAVMLLPPGADPPETTAQAVLDGLDGLVIAGGADIDPGRYGQPRGPETDLPRPERDAWELALVPAALERGMPLLGICRGLQVLNVALGGTLFQHLPDVAGQHRRQVGVYSHHFVRTAEGSCTASVIGAEVEVACHHHQAIDRLATGLVATAWADDGVLEAAETIGPGWVLGVQWHPEVAGGGPLFQALVEVAASWAKR